MSMTRTMTASGAPATRPRWTRGLAVYFGLLPAAVIAVFAYLGTMAWTVQISFTASRLLPVNRYVGFSQYERLFHDARWTLSLQNMVVFGILFIAGCLVVGFLLAVSIDQKVRCENTLRTIFLYPQAMSFIVTGLVWQWIMNPTLGLEKVFHDLGFETFRFDWIVNPNMALYVLVIAGIWHSSGLVMAILLAGLRGIDQELWKAARVDGIPPWRFHLHVIVPLLKPVIATAVVLLSIATVKVYDLVVALTNGGPGTATEVPAKYVMNYLFERQNIGLATAASTVMLITVLAVLAPWLYARHMRPSPKRRAAP